MLECLEIRDEQNFSSNFSGSPLGGGSIGSNSPQSELYARPALGPNCLKYGKFSFGNLEKGQGLTLANALRRVLLYEFPAYGVTTLSLKKVGFGDRRSLNDEIAAHEMARGPSPTDVVDVNEEDETVYHEFSSLPGVKESVIEILSNFKSLIFTPSTNYARLTADTTREGVAAGGSAMAAGASQVANQQSEIPRVGAVDPTKRSDNILGRSPSWGEIDMKLDKADQRSNLFVSSKGYLLLTGKTSLDTTAELTEETKSNLSVTPSQSKPTKPWSDIGEQKIYASQLQLPNSIALVNPNQVLATLMDFRGPARHSVTTSGAVGPAFLIEFTIDQITQTNLTNPYSFSGRAPLRSTRYRRLLPVDGTEFPIKKVNYTIEQDLSGKEVVFFEIWTNGAIQPKEAISEAIKKVVKLFQKFQ